MSLYNKAVAREVFERPDSLLRQNGGKRELVLSEMKNVLVVRLDEVGDVVMTTPFLRELRRNLPTASITLVVKPDVENLVQLCPYVDEILTYDSHGYPLMEPFQRFWRAWRLSRQRFRERRFDLAILPRWDADGYYGTRLLYRSAAHFRVGYSEEVAAAKRRKNKGLDRLLTHALRDSSLKHEVERSLDVIRFLGGSVQESHLELWVNEQDGDFATKSLIEQDVKPGQLLIGLGLSGGNSTLKQWPMEKFAVVGKWLAKEFGAALVVVGSEKEAVLGREIQERVGHPVVNLFGRTTLRQMAALLQRCSLYVGNDAGPMHVATAMGVPVLGLFGSSCHHRFGPWSHNSRVQWLGFRCSPCFQAEHYDRCSSCIFDHPRCLFEISVDQVQRAIVELIPTRPQP